MSRIGKMPIAVPDGVAVKIEDNKVVVTGPKGSLERCFNPEMTIALDGGSLTVSRPGDDRQHRAMHGLTRTLLDNMVKASATVLRRNSKSSVSVTVLKCRGRNWCCVSVFHILSNSSLPPVYPSCLMGKPR